jgi:hypothetical protein
VVLVKGQANLFHIVDTLGTSRAGARLLDRRDKQSNEDRNDGDHHEQLDQGEGTADQDRNRLDKFTPRQEEPTIGLDTRREEIAMVQSRQAHCQHFI